MKAKSLNFVALDIGSSKIAGIATYVDKKGEIQVSSQTLQYSSGFKSSIITDLASAEESILRTIYALEQECEKSIKQVSISLSGYKTKSYYVTCQIKLGSAPITRSDVKKLIEKTLAGFKAQDQEIIAYFPIEFEIDDNNLIKNPIGMVGRELKCQLHIIAANTHLLLNLTNCLAKCQIGINNFVLAIHASGLACLSEDEKNLGTLIIDMGAKTTSFGIFWLDKLVYSSCVDLGSFHITSDIAKVFALTIRGAEKLKILYGSAAPTAFEKDKLINLDEIDPENLDNAHANILMSELSKIITMRLAEIFRRIKTQYDGLAMEHLISKKIVITGGASTLKGIKEFANKIFDKQIVRLAKPIILPGFKEDHNPASYSTIIGIIQNYADKQHKDYIEGNSDDKNNGLVSKIIKWFKENI